MTKKQYLKSIILTLFVMGTQRAMAELIESPYHIEMKNRSQYLRDLAQSLQECAEQDRDALCKGIAKDRPSSLESLVISDVAGLENKWYLEHIKTVFISRYNLLATNNLLGHHAIWTYHDSLIREFNTYVLKEAGYAEQWIETNSRKSPVNMATLKLSKKVAKPIIRRHQKNFARKAAMIKATTKSRCHQKAAAQQKNVSRRNNASRKISMIAKRVATAERNAK